MLRNREIQQFAVFYAVLSAAVSIGGFLICPAAGVLAMSFAAVMAVAFFLFTKSRYNRIAELSEQIDHVLHNEEQLWISESEEGELSILQSEITKMTLCIREKNVALKKEKKHLADSLADIAHQLRTPLTSINLAFSLLKNNPNEKERKDLLREIKELLAQMDWLVVSLLKLSRLDAGIVEFQKEKTAADSLIASALRPFQIAMDLHNIALQVTLPEGMVLYGDFAWLSEAVQNLVKNCMESVGENGRIEIIGEDTPMFVQITFHDSGAGFAKEDLPFLFDRFYRGKNTGTTGYGIGLSLCRSIIIRQGGTLTAKNHPQGGAVFCIRFPK